MSFGPIPETTARRRARRAVSGTSGASLAEMALVLGLILAIVSVAIPAWMMVRHAQRIAMANSDVWVLSGALQRFNKQMGTWPSARGEGDVRFGWLVSNAEVVNALRAVDGPGNPHHSINTNRTPLLDVAPAAAGLSGLNAQGMFVDPWNTPYQIVLDLDYDNICMIQGSSYGRVEGRGFLVWSCGPDRQSDTPDDILSWRPPRFRKSALPAGM